MTSFAKKHSVKLGTLGVVFLRPYPRMERLIGDTIKIPPEQIWPDRYGADGRPNRFNSWYRRGSRPARRPVAPDQAMHPGGVINPPVDTIFYKNEEVNDKKISSNLPDPGGTGSDG